MGTIGLDAGCRISGRWPPAGPARGA